MVRLMLLLAVLVSHAGAAHAGAECCALGAKHKAGVPAAKADGTVAEGDGTSESGEESDAAAGI